MSSLTDRSPTSGDTLDDHPSISTVKLLNLGNSKTGKTGALCSLVEAGYRLWLLDYDNGIDIIQNIFQDKPDLRKRVRYRTLTDSIISVNGNPQWKSPVTAFRGAAKTLEDWQKEIGEFGPQDVIVLDTLSSFSVSAMNHTLAMFNRLNQRPHQTDYGTMADFILLFLQMITDKDHNYNVVVNTHIKYVEKDDESGRPARAEPNSKGQVVPNTVARFFNSVVLTHTVGTGPGTKRVISTKPQGVMDVATSNPIAVKASYPIETGLAELFRDILGHGPSATVVAPTSQLKQGT